MKKVRRQPARKKGIVVRGFIPSRDNDFKPLFLRTTSVVVVASIIFALFFGAGYLTELIKSGQGFLAAVVTNVLVDLTNVNRAEARIPELAVNPMLTYAAQLKANHMAELGYFSHNSPDGITPWHWFDEAGYVYSYAGENLAVNFEDSIEVTRAWMNSPTHRANIENANFTEIGIATSRGTYQGREAVFVVQLFGRPQQAITLTELAPVVASDAHPLSGGSVEGVVTDVNTVYDDGATSLTDAKPAPIPSAQKDRISSLVSRILSSPRTTLMAMYLALGVLIFGVLVLMIAIEIRRQHPVHLAYGVALLLLMVGLLSISGYTPPEILSLAS